LLRSVILLNTGDADGAESALSDFSEENVASQEQAAILQTRRGEIDERRGNSAEALQKATSAVAAAQDAHSYGTELSARLLRARMLHAQKKNKEAAAELAAIRAGVARYASVALRLQLAETALQVSGGAAIPDYRAARTELARLPSYVRALEIHALAVPALHEPADAAEARRAAQAAYEDLVVNAPTAQRPTLAKLAGSYGLETTIAHE